MKIVGIDKTNFNYYFKNDILFGTNPSGIVLDVLLYLSNYYLVNYQGSLGPKSKELLLRKTSIDISNCVSLNNDNMMFIHEDNKTNICPYCDRAVSNNYEFNLDNLLDDDLLITDTITEKVTNKSILILDNVKDIAVYSMDDLLFRFSQYKVIILSLKVYHFIKDKFLIDSEELYGKCPLDMLVIYRGKVGLDIFVNNMTFEKEIETKINVLDSTGGLASIASIIIKYYLENVSFDEKVVSKMFMDAEINYQKCVNKIGSNTYLIPLERNCNYSVCICENNV